ncbi:MAG: acetyl-CoA decarbonylase/synthase complex subunit delta [Lentisphaerae bacterium RIFOXYB12_FULL_65_16]|nr:MAG: acetyl-CoA decarbonylase/synthase complex subunit delta [Lentisphaerae bacterium RIFOXYA12_64_32]OGV91140.1 MAG: acetyl-CoA decarbonylase/synthase complex subunit delta [Lentisphaerae bacterium RIFOXYB12_FULL_65_16]
METAKEKWSGAVGTVVLGADAAAGGTRKSVVTLGGASTLPFLKFDGQTPHRPAVAMEVWDSAPEDWPAPLATALGDLVKSPVEWARTCVEKFGADLICLRLTSTHPDLANTSPQKAAETVKAVLKAISVPLIVWGCDQPDKDNQVLPVCSQAAAGERCLFGTVTEDNYKTLAVSCLADGHCLIGLSPIDINIAKQVNVLVTEMGFPLDRLVMYQTTGALGYGLEYTYSIQERGRLAALGGDRLMAVPVICMVGQEAWRTREARATEEELPGWGSEKERGLNWEIATAAALLQAGSDILVLRHPAAVAAIKTSIGQLMS